ncbi:MAG: Re/Si-specific NAD(P)(+) transhydrogenase subunit alpha [Planctomycetota bacterium]|nr:Re/Si-specific NAD(P)(+) transhydrogenase subunit alpha [Planctomycetota bacterium]
MRVAVPLETFSGERRVALVPAAIGPLKKLGLEICVESGAGNQAGYPDTAFAEAGAEIVTDRDALYAADIIAQVRTAGANQEGFQADLTRLRQGQIVIGMADPLGDTNAVKDLASSGATLFAMELIPRITRAQSMDVLSSMATVAGYHAVLLAATKLPKMFPMLMTAAGTLAAAKVFVIGGGVAGLQAIATARRLGGIVSAYDVRPAVREQVESLGGKFVEMELETDSAEGQGGYAKAMDEAFYTKQRALMAEVVSQSDVVVTTAAIPGRPSPLLITADAVQGMPPGSIIVDLAAERGGNCELSQADTELVEHGVTILGPTNLPSEVPYHASQMYAKNISNFLHHLVTDGEVQFDLEDEITRETMAAHDGQVTSARLREILKLEPLEKPEVGQEEGPADPAPIRLEDDDPIAETDKN